MTDAPGAGAEAPRSATRPVLLAAFLSGLVHWLLLAPFMGEDEPWHLEYALHVADGHRPTLAGGRAIDRATIEAHPLSQAQVWRKFASLEWPAIEARQQELLAALRRTGFWRLVDWAPPNSDARSFDQIAPGFTAVAQPVLYYLVLGAWLAPTRGLSVEGRLAWGRALSLLVHLATVWLALLLAREVFEDERLAGGAALVVALLPPVAHQAALVNNDALATPLATLLLVLAARALRPLAADEKRWPLALAILAAGLAAAATKLTASGALLVALAAFPLPHLARGRLRAALLAGGAALALVAGALALWHVQHNPALPRTPWAFVERLLVGFSPANLASLGEKLVGRFQWNSRALPQPLHLSVGLGVAAALSCALLAWMRRAPGLRRPALALCFAACAVQFVLVGLRGVGEARYMTPVAGAFAVLVVAGCAAPRSARARAAGLRLVVLALLAWSAAYLWLGQLVQQELGGGA